MDENTVSTMDADIISNGVSVDLPLDNIISLRQKIVHLTGNLNSWSSKMIVPHGDQNIDISSAAQGSLLSTAPAGIFPPQEITHHFKNDALYRFDGDRFKGLECKEKVRDLILSPNCVDGCKVSVKYSNSRPSMFRKHTWYFACSHARVHSQTQESFASGLVSKTNVSKQTLKRTKTQGTAVKGRF